MILTQPKFIQYRQTFYNKVTGTPYTCVLKVHTVSPVSDADEADFDSFVGDSPRSENEYSFNCLYQKVVNPRQRERLGLPDTVDGIIYLSPLQLVPVFGTFRINKNTTSVKFEEREQVIENITILEPIYGSCIGVQINLKDSLKGG